MRLPSLGLACLLCFPLSTGAAADPASEIRAAYERFYTAQNERNLDVVRAAFLNSPQFLWVSDGMSFWGPDAVIERMSLFQGAEIWRVEPDLAQAKAVALTDKSAMLHLPLTLVIGTKDKPDRLRFLVSALGVETAQGWRIAALLTTTQKSP